MDIEKCDRTLYNIWGHDEDWFAKLELTEATASEPASTFSASSTWLSPSSNSYSDSNSNFYSSFSSSFSTSFSSSFSTSFSPSFSPSFSSFSSFSSSPSSTLHPASSQVFPLSTALSSTSPTASSSPTLCSVCSTHLAPASPSTSHSTVSSLPTVLISSPNSSRPTLYLSPQFAHLFVGSHTTIDAREDGTQPTEKGRATSAASFCSFCRKNGEARATFMSHSVRDSEGRTRCPVLRRIVCELCGATDDQAHTLAYCPLSSTGSVALQVKSTARNSTGKRRRY